MAPPVLGPRLFGALPVILPQLPLGGAPCCSKGAKGPDTLATASAAAVELRRRGAPSAVLGGEGGHAVHLARLGQTEAAGGDDPPYLTVVGPDDPRCG
ncbi:hypothetical protein AB4Z54_59995, partial [Streptomyces sp. MCAF7]